MPGPRPPCLQRPSPPAGEGTFVVNSSNEDLLLPSHTQDVVLIMCGNIQILFISELIRELLQAPVHFF